MTWGEQLSEEDEIILEFKSNKDVHEIYNDYIELEQQLINSVFDSTLLTLSMSCFSHQNEKKKEVKATTESSFKPDLNPVVGNAELNTQ